MPTTNHHDHKHQQQLTLFPLHPENLVEQDHNMASIFSSCDNITTTLTQILCSENDDNENPNPSPSSVNYAQENVDLVRTAMRKTKTENIDQNNDEKWVCYSEVCSSISSTTTTSCHHINHCNDVDNNNNNDNNYRSKLVLKLDYEKIMKSWVNKGPLFIRGGSDVDAPYPQTVPDLHDDHFFLHSSINVTPHVDQDDDDGNAGSWTVPEMTHNENNGISRGDDALQAGESSVMGHKRKASVQRYKEKRRNRLFAKTVRYEVRKLNAQKRPRIKGRFVKSS
ncbi:hypothetical protein QVD17_18550 [Tagetes erecta]|uniref:CCT domain-containing protein n=1 Tax=Tagetes erecta TaxID=13708 RepID=A0AAD8KI43_TARER|nr:hypothetical protein QVD17_18550 [Tagetes erecta]